MLDFLYNTVPGRILLRAVSAPWVSKLCGTVLSGRISTVFIPYFVRKNGINLSDYVPCKFRSFNDFFTRQILPEKRPIDMDPASLISPCDGLLSAYHIENDTTFRIKGVDYSVSSLLGGSGIAEKFSDGTCLVFRLCVNNYHRYHYFDSGNKEENIFIPGVLHTVRPVALETEPVFRQNSREYTLMHTDNFGDAVQIEVGALLVGKIKNHRGASHFIRGDEKGMFLYGGSTVVVLLQSGKAEIPQKLFDDTENNIEFPVKMGQKIGAAK